MPKLDAFAALYPGIPSSVMLKIDLVRRGVRLGDAPVGTRHYHHHDERGQKALGPRAHLQGSVVLPDGTTVFIAQNPASPYVIQMEPDSRLTLREGPHGELICDLTPGPRFAWTSRRTAQQTPMASVFTPSLGGVCGPVAVFLLRHCEFAVDGEECRFCSWVRMGKSQEMRPNVDDFRETLDAIWQEQHSIGYLAFSGGSLFDRTKEADAFLRYMEAVRHTGLPLPPTVAAIQALDAKDTERLRRAQFDYACYSMEVWDEAAWQDILPGKARSVGRAGWMKCLVDAVDVFGEGHVLCNFVAGVETAVPGLYPSPEAAADATLRGMRWCYERGIYPKYATWVVSGGAAFEDREPAALDYYAHLVVGRQALYSEFPMSVPSTDCRHCLTQSVEADLALLDAGRYGVGPAAAFGQEQRHRVAHVGSDTI
ncbi:MAG: hypothetical protein A3H97_07030 [Acidobacteria bacterium RIFCSPLOWO2_02_FULL_65_29]|nr:MAG: hypothetical protein A3H97_07030 [Acidobacteria bacterium RIFCSPLOWO2_02_FULL_65_29]